MELIASNANRPWPKRKLASADQAERSPRSPTTADPSVNVDSSWGKNPSGYA